MDINHDNFVLNSANTIAFLHKLFEDDFDSFIREKLAAGKKNYTDEQFFQAMSEVHLLYYLAHIGEIKEKYYEPTISPNGKNPEASFVYSNGVKINIEVKTPDYSQCIHKKYDRWIQPSVAYDRLYLKLNDIVEEKGFKLIPPFINKMKDFINSACEKFLPVNNRNEFNILAINYYGHPWENKAVAEGYCSLMNETTGILYSDITRKKLNISESIERISAFVLYQCTSETLLNSDLRFSWPFIRLIRNPLCSDIDFAKLWQMLLFDSSDYFKPMIPMGKITDLRYYIFHDFPQNICDQSQLNEIQQELCTAQSLFIET